MPELKLFLAEPGDGQYIVPDEMFLSQLGLTFDESVELFGEQGKWHIIEIHPPTHGLQQEANRRCLIPDTEKGFVVDQTRLAAARAAVLVKAWDFKDADGTPIPPGESDKLPPNVAQAVDGLILTRMYPSVFASEGFLKALEAKRKTPGPKKNPQGKSSSKG